jgi:hypothetical protein
MPSRSPAEPPRCPDHHPVQRETPAVQHRLHMGDDDVARISVTDSRAKAKNLRRDPRASLYAVGDD